MPTYTDVTNLSSTPASLSDADTHLSLTTPGINAQHYEWQGNSAGFWNPVNDDNGGVATDTYLTERTQKFSYDFDIDGGAIGDITMRGGTIPAGALIVRQVCNITTEITGVTNCHIKIGVEASDDIQSSLTLPQALGVGMSDSTIPVAENAYATDNKSVVFIAGTVGAASGLVITTAIRSVTMNIATAAVVTGAYDLYLTYMVPA